MNTVLDFLIGYSFTLGGYWIGIILITERGKQVSLRYVIHGVAISLFLSTLVILGLKSVNDYRREVIFTNELSWMILALVGVDARWIIQFLKQNLRDFLQKVAKKLTGNGSNRQSEE